MGRAPCCDKASVKRGPWSPEEDATLKRYVETHGTGGNWIALPQKAGLKRCGKSCRLRWLNYLRPDIKHGNFTDDEDRVICSLYSQMGSRWSIIASHLPRRTDNDVKNYWNTKLKKKLLAGKVSLQQQQLATTHTAKENFPITSSSSSISISQSDHFFDDSISRLLPCVQKPEAYDPQFPAVASQLLQPMLTDNHHHHLHLIPHQFDASSKNSTSPILTSSQEGSNVTVLPANNDEQLLMDFGFGAGDPYNSDQYYLHYNNNGLYPWYNHQDKATSGSSHDAHHQPVSSLASAGSSFVDLNPVQGLHQRVINQ